MSVGRRIGKILTGILLIAGAIFMLVFPEFGYLVLAVALAVTLLVSGISSLVYFFTMARHMVGGRSTLYSALIRIDFAVLTLTLTNIPKIFIMLYLVAVFGVTGLLHVLGGMEAKKKAASNWYWRFISGVINLLIALLCLIFIQNYFVLGIVYSVGLIFTGLGRIVSAFYRSKIVYIQ